MTSDTYHKKRLSDRTMLVGIGAQKTGTTWLHNYLSGHPQVWVSPIKELHVFDHRHLYDAKKLRTTLLNRSAKLAGDIIHRNGKQSGEAYELLITSALRAQMIDELDKYIEYFAHRVEDQAVFGEITPAYSLLPKAGFREILSLHPNVKFVFIMRDPIRRAWSHINDLFERRQISMSDDEKLAAIMSNESPEKNPYFSKSNYKKTIETVESCVDPSNILYLFYEHLFSQGSVERLCNFLQIEPRSTDFSKRVNAGPSRTSHLLSNTATATIYDPVYNYCYAKFGAAIPSEWTSK